MTGINTGILTNANPLTAEQIKALEKEVLEIGCTYAYLDENAKICFASATEPSPIKELAWHNAYELKSLGGLLVNNVYTKTGLSSFELSETLYKHDYTESWGDVSYSEGLSYELADNTYSVQNIDTCTDTYIIIPAIYNGRQVTSIGARAFDECRWLTNIIIPDSVTSIGASAFRLCTSLSSITIPYGVAEISEAMCYTCTSLTSVQIPDSVMSISWGAFYDCWALANIALSDNVTQIGDCSFIRCIKLSQIVIPDSVMSIGIEAFAGCEALTKVVIGAAVTNIGDYAFENCTELDEIIYNGTFEQFQRISLGDDWANGIKAKYVQCTNGRVSLL